jgi:hypothetical protein
LGERVFLSPGREGLRKKIGMIAGRTEESDCPTLTCKGFRYAWGGRFRLPTDFFSNP